jgi:hypothetical protein
MTSASHDVDHDQRTPREADRPHQHRLTWTAVVTAAAAVLGIAVLAAGCGGSTGSRIAGSASIKAQFLAYSRCMRSHRISDFPDPTTLSGGGFAFQINAGPGSDLSPHNTTFKAANQACRGSLPGDQHTQTGSDPHIAAEVRWARCLRSHGVPSFPDPNSQGAFDSAQFNDDSPAFKAASKACNSVQPTGAVSAVAGPG